MLIRELAKIGDDFISVKLEDREYIIESIGHIIDDVNRTHICLNIRDGGTGEIRR